MPRRVKGSKKGEEQEIASERIKILFDLAEKAAISKKIPLADRYVKQARSIGMRYTVRIPKEYRSRICKYCYAYLFPGITSRTRINSNKHRVEVECLRCKRAIFFPYIREIKAKRRKKFSKVATLFFQKEPE